MVTRRARLCGDGGQDEQSQVKDGFEEAAERVEILRIASRVGWGQDEHSLDQLGVVGVITIHQKPEGLDYGEHTQHT
jgi:hypothetical protein